MSIDLALDKMIKVPKYPYFRILFILSFLLISACSNKDEIDPVTGKQKIYEVNPQKKAEAFRDKGGGLFNSSRSTGGNFEFSTSNILWRASLKTLNDIPLQNVDYSGGIIITDWYSPSNEMSRESIKIKIRFLSNILAINSVEITSHKKTCDSTNACSITTLKNSFNEKIKNKIIEQAKVLKLEEEKKKQ